MTPIEVLRRAKALLLQEGHDPFYCLNVVGKNEDYLTNTKAVRYFVLNHTSHQERDRAADLDIFDRAIALAEAEEHE